MLISLVGCGSLEPQIPDLGDAVQSYVPIGPVASNSLPGIINVTDPATGKVPTWFRIKAYIEMNPSLGMVFNRGTGFVVKHNDKLYMVTAYHVIDGSNMIAVETHDNEPFNMVLGQMTFYSARDIAIFEIKSMSVKIIPFVIGEATENDDLLAIGYASGIYTTSIGTLLRGYESGMIQDGLYTTNIVDGGMSGGPLLNGKGQVVGVTSMKVIGSESNLNALFGNLKAAFSLVK